MNTFVCVCVYTGVPSTYGVEPAARVSRVNEENAVCVLYTRRKSEGKLGRKFMYPRAVKLR